MANCVSMKENASLSSLLPMCLDPGEIGLNDTLPPIFHMCSIIWIIRKIVGCQLLRILGIQAEAKPVI